MDEIVLNAYGKINLALDVLYKRDDGYHEINTIMQQIQLKDKVKLTNIQEGIIIESTDENLPLDKSNLAYKAWEKLVEKTGTRKGVHIFIEKDIPIASGLAGGSSNCAAVLKGLNKLWKLNLSQEELMEIGLEIGADVPFCLLGGTAKATGIGEKLTPLKGFSNKNILLANPDIPILTSEVYESLNLSKDSIDINPIINYIEKDDILNVGKNMYNIMEDVVIKDYPIIGDIKNTMLDMGALGSIMSGSGATVFGLFDSMDKLKACKEKLEETIEKVFISRTL